ncbi:hypothetical protein BJ508DRAFT_52548 [Ascobolus immersus RN42]|uniref:NACHT domain-containing protein n=1 Tax=Ascobolus immersus RN42 TaxID=1160509 RepID=A0A3N4IE93_ASCIM|nr:hypothetical protein BJ508DRAFT_52548 [Ascobolus immersus RN42]
MLIGRTLSVFRPFIIEFGPFLQNMEAKERASKEIAERVSMGTIIDIAKNTREIRETQAIFMEKMNAALSVTLQFAEETSRTLPKIMAALPTSKDAELGSFENQHDATCLEGTRVELLNTLIEWVNDAKQPGVFWLNGAAGTGKSTIARSIAARYSKEKRLAAQFFFSRGGGDRSNARRFFTTLAVQLCTVFPPLQVNVLEAINEDPKISERGLQEQWTKLILGPIEKLDSQRSALDTILIVIDALDECDGDDDCRTIVKLLASSQSLEFLKFRIFITSRPETPIRLGFQKDVKEGYTGLVLHEVPASTIERDIQLYLRHRLGQIRNESDDNLDDVWPGDDRLQKLCQKAKGLFIYASTACLFIGEDPYDAEDRLELILQDDYVGKSMNASLDLIYSTILKKSITFKGCNEKETAAKIRLVIGSIVALQDVLSLASLERLLTFREPNGKAKVSIRSALHRLHSVFTVPVQKDEPVKLLHPSFRDYLFSNERCRDKKFWIDSNVIHLELLQACIGSMSCLSSGLRKDICGLQHPGVSRSEIDQGIISSRVPQELQYACRYWALHFTKCHSVRCGRASTLVFQFLKVHLLHWIETMALMGFLNESLIIVLDIEDLLSDIKFCVTDVEETLLRLLRETKLLVRQNRQLLENTPLQLYASALAFAPTGCYIRQIFKHEAPNWMDTTSYTGNGQFNNWPSSDECISLPASALDLLFSSDGRSIASVVENEEEQTQLDFDICDTRTGHSQYRFGAAVKEANSLCPGYTGAFSPDGKRLAVMLCTGLSLWDIETGSNLRPYELDFEAQIRCGRHSIGRIVFSSDGKFVIAISRTLCLHPDGVYGDRACSSNYMDQYDPNRYHSETEEDRLVLGVWDAATGEFLRVFEDILKDDCLGVRSSPWRGAISAVESSANGESVRYALLNDMSIWETNITTGKTSLVHEQPHGLIDGGRSIAARENESDTVGKYKYSAPHICNGKVIMFMSLTTSDRTHELWELGSGRLICTLEQGSEVLGKDYIRGTNAPFGREAWDDPKPWKSPEYDLPGIEAAVSSDGGLVAFSVRPSHGQVENYAEFREGRRGERIAPYGVPTLGWVSEVVQVREIATGTLRCSFRRPSKFAGHHSVQSMAFSPNSKLLASDSFFRTTPTLIWSVPESPDQTTDIDKRIQRRDSTQMTISADFYGKARAVISPHGDILAHCSAHLTVYLWDLKVREPYLRLSHAGTTPERPDWNLIDLHLLFSSDSRKLAVLRYERRNGASVRILEDMAVFDTNTGLELRRFSAGKELKALRNYADDNWFAIFGYNRSENGQDRFPRSSSSGEIFSCDGTLVYFSDRLHNVSVWEIDTGERRMSFTVDDPFYSLMFLPSNANRLVAIAENRKIAELDPLLGTQASVTIWDGITGQKLKRYMGPAPEQVLAARGQRRTGSVVPGLVRLQIRKLRISNEGLLLAKGVKKVEPVYLNLKYNLEGDYLADYLSVNGLTPSQGECFRCSSVLLVGRQSLDSVLDCSLRLLNDSASRSQAMVTTQREGSIAIRAISESSWSKMRPLQDATDEKKSDTFSTGSDFSEPIGWYRYGNWIYYGKERVVHLPPNFSRDYSSPLEGTPKKGKQAVVRGENIVVVGSTYDFSNCLIMKMNSSLLPECIERVDLEALGEKSRNYYLSCPDVSEEYNVLRSKDDVEASQQIPDGQLENTRSWVEDEAIC